MSPCRCRIPLEAADKLPKSSISTPALRRWTWRQSCLRNLAINGAIEPMQFVIIHWEEICKSLSAPNKSSTVRV